MALWACLALLNLAGGIMVASWPERQTDLETVHRWGQEWLVEHTNVYEAVDLLPDYPPLGIMVLSPIALMPMRVAIPVWASLNILLALAVPFLAIRSVRPHMALSQAILPALMFLTWGGFRTLLQFTLLTLVCGFASVVLARQKRPYLAGVFLALSLMKPHVAVPFVLWAVFTRQARVVWVALAAVVASVGIYCLSAGYSPAQFVARYAEILRIYYAGNAIKIGSAQLRPLAMLVTPNPVVVDVVCLVVAAFLLAVILAIGFAEGRQRRSMIVAAPPLVAIWSLLTFYHLTYGFLLLLSPATWLLFLNDPPTRTFRRRLFWVLQLALMFDVATVWRWLSGPLGLPGAAGAMVAHVDRFGMLALLGCLIVLYAKTRNAEPRSEGTS